MSLTDIILTIAIITLFCLGLRTLFSSGMILHFMREPFEFEEESKLMNFLKRKVQSAALQGTENLHNRRKKFAKLSERISFFLKPFLLCVICFSSVWGATVFMVLHGLHHIPEMFICCISSAFVIKIINDHVEF